jgi:hypothetical protein
VAEDGHRVAAVDQLVRDRQLGGDVAAAVEDGLQDADGATLPGMDTVVRERGPMSSRRGGGLQDR